METIFHEKQEGALCAQHCLNSLLQGSYFTAVDLSSLAQQMDDEEQKRMSEGGVNSAEYHRFLQQPSGNMDDSGYFSVQVIAAALKVWNLDIVPISSSCSVSQAAQTNPTGQSAYICNYKDHWFTIRKIGQQWFNLNSLLSAPDLISDTYLSIFLAQLQQEGYAIFLVIGILPTSEADDLLKLTPVTQTQKPYLLTTKSSRSSGNQEEDQSLQEALKQSLEATEKEDRAALEAALALSLNDKPSTSRYTNLEVYPATDDNQDEDEMLREAIKLSMEPS